MAAIALIPASGDIINTETAVRVEVSGADSNDLTAYDADAFPSSPAFLYYLLFEAPAGTDNKKSYEFNVSADGDHIFNNFIFDVAGSWTVRFRNAANDSDVATAAVTVS